MSATSTERWRKWRDSHSRNHGSPEVRERHRQRCKEKRAQWRREGLCVACGKKRDEAGFLCCRKCRGSRLAPGQKLAKQPRRHTSPKWEALEASMLGACERCWLRGDHECIPTRADGWSRTGPGRVYPEGM